MKAIPLLLLSILIRQNAFAMQWSDNSEINSRISRSNNTENMNPLIISNDNSHFIIIWIEKNDQQYKIMAQYVDSTGSKKWLEGGITLAAMNSSRSLPIFDAVMLDNKTFVITWKQNDAIFAQMFRDGTAVWVGNKVINSSGKSKMDITISKLKVDPTAETADEFVISWLDDISPAATSDFMIGRNIKAQKIDESGSTLWREEGVAVYNLLPIIKWKYLPSYSLSHDSKGAVYYAFQIVINDWWAVVQKLDNSGNVLTEATPVGVNPKSPTLPQLLLTDNKESTDVFVSWISDMNSGTSGLDIYAQLIHFKHENTQPELKWGQIGIPVCTNRFNQLTHKIAEVDGNFYIFWWDDRPTPNSSPDNLHVYGNKINKNGDLLWGTEGTKFGTSIGPEILENFYEHIRCVPDKIGNLIISWTSQNDLVTKKIDKDGNLHWGTGLDPLIISNASARQQQHQIIQYSGEGIISVWQDTRNSMTSIYMQNINTDGLPGNRCNPPESLTYRVIEIHATTSKNIELHWKDKSKIEDGFIVERWIGNEQHKQQILLNPNSTSYLAQNIAPDTKYSFRVSTFKNNSVPAQSGILTFIIPSDFSAGNPLIQPNNHKNNPKNLSNPSGEFSDHHTGKTRQLINRCHNSINLSASTPKSHEADKQLTAVSIILFTLFLHILIVRLSLYSRLIN
ncbi:MAG: fibronectin type III domain-containing protein [Planctomycetes bacterium]|nr:fibronectin type III domain-containing protein [Planctomycetota bacterium]